MGEYTGKISVHDISLYQITLSFCTVITITIWGQTSRFGPDLSQIVYIVDV